MVKTRTLQNHQCGIKASIRDNHYCIHMGEWGYEVYCSLYGCLLVHSSPLKVQRSVSYDIDGTRSTPHPQLKNIIIIEQKHEN